MNVGLAIDKKNGIESKVIGKVYKGSSPLPNNHNGTFADGQIDGEFEIKEAQNEWQGWGTALKPSFEPIIVARKPFKGSLVDNIIEYGVGGINIDECRVGNDVIKGGTMAKMGTGDLGVCNYQIVGGKRIEREDNIGRFPANTILTYDKTDEADVCGGMPIENNQSASRYFYCAKASAKDRDEGLRYLEYYALNEDIDENIKNHIKRLLNQ